MTSTIRQAVHILSKDVRYLRIQIALCYLLSLIFWLSFLQETIASEWSLLMNFAYVACTISLIYSATKQDSVTNSSTWWATRPISSQALFLSKLMLWIVAIGLPLALSTAAVSIRFQLDGWQTLLSVTEVVLITGVIAGFAATLTSVSKLNAGLGITLGGLTLLILIGSLANHSSGSDYHSTGSPAVLIRERRHSIGLVILALVSIGAWGLRLTRRKQGASVLLLLAGLFVFGFIALSARQGLSARFQLTEEDSQRISVSLLDKPSPLPNGRQGTQLYNHFVFSGLRTNEFVSLDWIEADFRWRDGPDGRVMAMAGAPGNINQQFERFILSQLQSTLLSHFPSETTWHSEWQNRRNKMLPIAHPDEHFTINPETTGDFEGTIQANVLKLTSIRSLPLEAAVYDLDPGRSLDLQAVEPQWDSIRLKFSLTRPLLALSKNPEINLATPYTREDTRYVFVIYHPGMQEGYLLKNAGPSRHRTTRTLIPISKQAFTLKIPFSSLQSAINGLSMTEWLEKAELRVFKIEMVGNKSFSFSKPNYRPYQDSSYLAPAPDSLTGIQLPDHASAEEAEQFIKSVLAEIPDQYTTQSISTIREKLESMDPKHLPILLDNLPDDEGIVNSYFLRPITKLIRPEHLPAFKKLWSERDLFITEIRRRKWSNEVRDTLIQRIRGRRTVSPIAIAIAAEAGDPATYPDLEWHFVKSRWGHETMLSAFQHCDGLQIDPLIRESWKRARLDLIQPDQLAIPAAALGLPDALRHARSYMNKLEGDRRDGVLTAIRDLTSYEGPEDAFEAWFEQHFAELAYDSTTKKYARTTG